jgi:hypothetical protein
MASCGLLWHYHGLTLIACDIISLYTPSLGFNPSILRHSGICGAAEKKYTKIQAKKMVVKQEENSKFP